MDLPTSTLLTLASITPSLIQATATPTTPNTHVHKSQDDTNNNDTTTNIIFGVLAVVLALIGILLAWLQIRGLRQRSQHTTDGDIEQWQQQPELEMQVVETYTLTRYKALHLPKTKLHNEHSTDVCEVEKTAV